MCPDVFFEVFHEKCIDEWLRRCTDCPICKATWKNPWRSCFPWITLCYSLRITIHSTSPKCQMSRHQLGQANVDRAIRNYWAEPTAIKVSKNSRSKSGIRYWYGSSYQAFCLRTCDSSQSTWPATEVIFSWCSRVTKDVFRRCGTCTDVIPCQSDRTLKSKTKQRQLTVNLFHP